jgi:carbamate kinase
MSSQLLAVIAVGGNALVTDNEHTSIRDQVAAARRLSASVAGMLRSGWRVVLTHGNGPQVGFILRRSDLAASMAPEIPRLELDMCGADSQGGIGHILGTALSAELAHADGGQPLVALITHTLVAQDDPAFQAPTKPIGSFYTREEAERLRAEEGWSIVADSGRGYRRVVPSPRPLRILELDAIATLVHAGFTVVAAGGGGIPVIEEPGGGYRGVEAVIDKDFSAAIMASALQADLLVITTGVAQLALDFGRPSQRNLARVTADEARRYLEAGEFPPGSMGPKVQAALEYLVGGTGEVVITCPSDVVAAVNGATGTRIVR